MVDLGHFVKNEIKFAAEFGNAVVELSVFDESFLLVILFSFTVFLNLLQLLILLELFFKCFVTKEVNAGNQHFDDLLFFRIHLHFLIADYFFGFELGIIKLLGFVSVNNVEQFLLKRL